MIKKPFKKPTSIEELENALEYFRYEEEAILTDGEVEILREMFSVKGSFRTLFKYMVTIESEKGTMLAYDIESAPTGEDAGDHNRFAQMLVRFLRSKMEGIRSDFAQDYEEDLKEVKGTKELKQAELKDKEEEGDLKESGLPKHM